jgi:hypothetical protein
MQLVAYLQKVRRRNYTAKVCDVRSLEGRCGQNYLARIGAFFRFRYFADPSNTTKVWCTRDASINPSLSAWHDQSATCLRLSTRPSHRPTRSRKRTKSRASRLPRATTCTMQSSQTASRCWQSSRPSSALLYGLSEEAMLS